MKKLILLLLPMVLVVGGCKKSSSPSIVGTWKISNISGSYSDQASPTAATVSVIYSYTNSVLKEQVKNSSFVTLVNITISSELWQFNNDGTFSIYEDYEADTSVTPVTHTLSGWWDYTGSTIPNSDIVLRSAGTPSILPIGGTYFIQQVTDDQMILTVKETNSLSTGETVVNDFVLTFMKE